MTTIDLDALAPLLGAAVKGDTIIVPSLGKDFTLDRQGKMTPECHIITWVLALLLSCHKDYSGG